MDNVDYETRCKELEIELKKYKSILASVFPDQISGPFICGSSTEKDGHGLPNVLHICPAYGAQITAVYEKIKIG
jgi:hypothetical protein